MPGPSIVFGDNRHAVTRSNLVLMVDASLSQSYAGSGTAWNDVSGNSNNFTAQNGSLFTSDGKKSYLQFDGATGNRNFTTSYTQPLYSTSTGYSWSIWVNPQASNTAPILGNRTSGGVANGGRWVKLGSRRMEYSTSNAANTIGATGAELMDLDVWQYINIVWEIGGTLRAYKNAVEFGTTTYAAQTVNLPFYIGGDLVQPERSTSKVAYVAVHSAPLTQAQITNDFNVMRGGFGV